MIRMNFHNFQKIKCFRYKNKKNLTELKLIIIRDFRINKKHNLLY